MIFFDDSLPHFRGNLHLHTTCSDGTISPSEAVALYVKAGYDFLAVTDHWHCYDGPTEFHSMTILPGIELDVQPDRWQTAHIVGFGVTPALDAQVCRGDTPQQLIDAICADGGYAILAHPAWSLNTNEWISGLKNLTAAEVFNSLSRPPWNADRADSSNLLDIAAARGVTLPWVATDDTHFYNGEQFCGFTVVQCVSPDADQIASALKARHCYASQGPAFTHIEISDGSLYIDCTPATEIMVCSNLFYRKDRCLTGQALTGRTYSIRSGEETFVRCRITDAQGRHAWTSPFPV